MRTDSIRVNLFKWDHVQVSITPVPQI